MPFFTRSVQKTIWSSWTMGSEQLCLSFHLDSSVPIDGGHVPTPSLLYPVLSSITWRIIRTLDVHMVGTELSAERLACQLYTLLLLLLLGLSRFLEALAISDVGEFFKVLLRSGWEIRQGLRHMPWQWLTLVQSLILQEPPDYFASYCSGGLSTQVIAGTTGLEFHCIFGPFQV